MIISVVAAKIWYLKKCAVFIGPPWAPCTWVFSYVQSYILGAMLSFLQTTRNM